MKGQEHEALSQHVVMLPEQGLEVEDISLGEPGHVREGELLPQGLKVSTFRHWSHEVRHWPRHWVDVRRHLCDRLRQVEPFREQRAERWRGGDIDSSRGDACGDSRAVQGMIGVEKEMRRGLTRPGHRLYERRGQRGDKGSKRKNGRRERGWRGVA